MKQGFGIAALVVAILAIFVPFYSVVVSGVALILAAVAALAGDRPFAIATPLIAAANLFLFSPVTLAGLAHSSGGWVIVLIFLALPVAAIALNASGKLVLGE